MANSLLTIDMITRKSLQIFENQLVLSRNVNRQYDNSFAKEGAKIGASMRVRLPDRVLVTDGAALGVQDDVEQFTNIAITSQKHVGVNFTSAELTLNLDDFADRVLKPRISQLAATVDADLASVYLQIANSVGTPGTVPSTSLVLLQGQQKLNEMAVDTNSRFAVVNPAANAGLVEGMKGFFNPQGTISEQFKSGMMAQNVLGYDEIAMSQSIRNFRTGTRTNGTVTSTVTAQNTTTLSLSGLGANATIAQGDVFTIAGVNMVNPQTRESVGSLQQFTVVAPVVATGGGVASVTVYPAIVTASEAFATVDTFPVAAAAVTWFGGANQLYPQNIIAHKNAISLATADLMLPEGVAFASRAVHNGISMRIVKQYDINNDRMPCRIDVLYGFKALRPEMACRLFG